MAHLLATAALTVGQIHLRQTRQGSVCARVLHINSEVATAPIQVQPPGLKYRALVAVKARKGDKVVEQAQQVTLQEDELVQALQRRLVGLLSAVLLNQGLQLGQLATC